MESYFSDLQIRIVMQHTFHNWRNGFMQTASNSLEFLASGEMILEIRGKAPVHLKAPVCFWMQEGSFFHFSIEKSTPPLEHLYVDFSGDRGRRMIQALARCFPEGAFTPADPAAVKNTLKEMNLLYRENPERNHGRLTVLLEKLMQMTEDSRYPAPASSETYPLAQLTCSMRENPFAQYDFAKIAKKWHITQDHFRRIFCQKYEMTPRAYLLHLRLTHAEELLVHSNMQIKEIEYLCGFHSASVFSRILKKHTGKSPREYRRKALL